MCEKFLDGLSTANCRSLRRLVISGMCLEAEGCNRLRSILKAKALPGLQELIMAGRRKFELPHIPLIGREQHHGEGSFGNFTSIERDLLSCSTS